MDRQHSPTSKRVIFTFIAFLFFMQQITALAISTSADLKKAADDQCRPSTPGQILLPYDCRQAIFEFARDNPIQNSVLVHAPAQPQLGQIVCPYIALSGSCSLTLDFDSAELSLNIGAKSQLEASMRKLVADCVGKPGYAGGTLHFLNRKAIVRMGYAWAISGGAGNLTRKVGDAYALPIKKGDMQGQFNSMVESA
ncbi:MAG: hypothetical protein Q9164_003978 [Protoblastenia rupestris]